MRYLWTEFAIAVPITALAGAVAASSNAIRDTWPRDGYSVASKTWIPDARFLPAVTLCFTVTYHHRDAPTVPPATEPQRLL